MNRYSNVCLQSFFGFGSQVPGKTKLKELKQGRFVSFQNIPSSYDYDLKDDILKYQDDFVLKIKRSLHTKVIYCTP